jgi:HD superfamily phosphohydrolase
MSYYEYKFAKVPRLSLNSICNDKIIDPLYGEINLNKYVCYLLAFPIVDRLREIKQLGLTDLVYIGATHTRLEHSFGVSYLLSKLPADLNDQERVILSLIGLLHDIGHSGWGHALDGITSKVVVEISDIIGMETFPIFSPKKLDIAITSYLLYNNDQLKRALTEIAKDLSKQQGSPVFTSSDGLRDFIAWVISEEERGDVFYCKSWKSDIVKQFEPLARYFQNLLGFKVNADRLDWIERTLTTLLLQWPQSIQN